MFLVGKTLHPSVKWLNPPRDFRMTVLSPSFPMFEIAFFLGLESEPSARIFEILDWARASESGFVSERRVYSLNRTLRK